LQNIVINTSKFKIKVFLSRPLGARVDPKGLVRLSAFSHSGAIEGGGGAETKTICVNSDMRIDSILGKTRPRDTVWCGDIREWLLQRILIKGQHFRVSGPLQVATNEALISMKAASERQTSKSVYRNARQRVDCTDWIIYSGQLSS
jgi:hypothetical protein